jgi:hypothetical protein
MTMSSTNLPSYIFGDVPQKLKINIFLRYFQHHQQHHHTKFPNTYNCIQNCTIVYCIIVLALGLKHNMTSLDQDIANLKAEVAAKQGTLNLLLTQKNQQGK